MVANAPTCPRCAWPLTWFASHQQWGCDRCRVLSPSAAPPAGRSGGGLIPLVGVGLLIGGIVRCQTAPAIASGGGDAGAYVSENNHYAAVYLGVALGIAGAVFLLIGLWRMGRRS